MTPRPIHRWKTFWLGIILIAFLGWSWWESTHWLTFMRHRQVSISHAGSGICLADWKRGQSRFEWQRQQIPTSEETWGRPRLEAPEIFRSTGQPYQFSNYYQSTPIRFEPRNAAARHFIGLLSSKTPGSRAIYIPHWLLIATFLIPWSAILISRSRRMKRLTAGSAAPPARSST